MVELSQYLDLANSSYRDPLLLVVHEHLLQRNNVFRFFVYALMYLSFDKKAENLERVSTRDIKLN